MSRLNAVARSHRIVELLARQYFDGAANKELAEALHVSPVNISRDLAQLEALGYARKLENGRWSLTPKPVAVYQSFTTHYQNMQNRMAEAGRNILAASLRD
jgi:DNA-binding IclR family transcriptional regulator